MPRIDKYVYLDCSVQTVLSHMRKRGRDYEDELDLMYVYELKALLSLIHISGPWRA